MTILASAPHKRNLSAILAAHNAQIAAGDGLTDTGSGSSITLAVDITGSTDKATPVGADEILLGDSAVSGAIKKADLQSIVTAGIAATTALLEGKQTKWIAASDMIPATTTGADAGQIESTTNKINVKTWDFQGATADEYAHFNFAFPKDWNLGTITFQAFWTTTNAATDGVAWGLQAVAVADDGAQDAVYGTAVVVTDVNIGAALDILVTDESAVVTISGTLAAGMLTEFRVLRDIDDPADDMTEDASLIGIKLHYTTNAANDD